MQAADPRPSFEWEVWGGKAAAARMALSRIEKVEETSLDYFSENLSHFSARTHSLMGRTAERPSRECLEAGSALMQLPGAAEQAPEQAAERAEA